MFTTNDKNEAIQFYKNHVLSIKHHHLIVMTSSQELVSNYKTKLRGSGIEVFQNDISNYSSSNKLIYRLFVFEKATFKVKEIDKSLPVIDKKIK